MHHNDLGAWDRGEGEYPPSPPSPRRISAPEWSPPPISSAPSPRGSPPASPTPAGAAPDPDCPRCRGGGWMVADVRYGHPQFGQLQRCACLEASAVTARKADLAVRVATLTAQLSEEMGRLRACQLDQLDLRRDLLPVIWRGEAYSELDQRKMLGRAVGLARTFTPDDGEGLYLYGPNGTGKSHIAAAILNAAVARGVAARYGSAPALLRLLRQGFRDGSADDRLEALAGVPLLALDDLGTESPSDWADASLFDLLKARDAGGRATIVTANIPIAELRDPRIASLIQGNSLLVPLITSDYRALLAERRAS